MGANIGMFTLFLLRNAMLPACIYAAEPLPPNLALLRHNVAGDSRVTVLPLAVGAAPSLQTFSYWPRMPGNSTAKPAEKVALQAAAQSASRFSEQQLFNCEVATVSAIIRAHQISHIDLLKIDCEGMELDALQGIEAQHWPTIRQVVLEVHGVTEGSGLSRLQMVQDILRSHSFDVVCEACEPQGNVLVYAR